jgi:hypothetical protein
MMSPNSAHDDDTHASGDTATATTPASLAGAQEAIPGLLDDIVVTHVLRSEYFDDPADLARLPAVSRAMRDAVAATGLEFVEIRDEDHAVELGCLSALQRRQRGGRLSRRELLCQAAARSGQLEELKALRADGWPWNKYTCARAAEGRHIEVLQWLRANGCPWDENTCVLAALGGHFEVLQWARANGCPWNEYTCSSAAKGGHLEVLQWARVNGCPWDTDTCVRAAAMAGHLEVLQWLRAKAVRGTSTRVRKRRKTGTSNCCSGCARTAARWARGRAGRAPGGASVVARERLPVGRAYVHVRGGL